MSTTRKLNEAFANVSLDDEKRCPLEKHINYFGGKREGEHITCASMAQQNKNLGDSNFTSKTTAAKVSFGAGIIIKHCPFSQFKPKDAVGKLNHSHHSGIFNLDGTINEEIWSVLCRYASTDSAGTKILTKTKFYEFLDMRRLLEGKSDLFGKIASNGEWTSYWEKFSSTNGLGQQYVTLQKFRDFFEDSSKPGLEVEEHIRNKNN